MKMELENNKFWVVRDSDKGKITLYDNFGESVEQVRELMSQDRKSESIELMEAKLEGEKASFKGVNWGKIAEKLVDVD